MRKTVPVALRLPIYLPLRIRSEVETYEDGVLAMDIMETMILYPVSYKSSSFYGVGVG